MPLLHRFHQTVITQTKLEHRDPRVVHELRGDGAAGEIGKLFSAACDVLFRLHGRKLIIPALRLHWDDVLATVAVDAYVNLVDLDLTETLHGSAEMILPSLLASTSNISTSKIRVCAPAS